jgi:acyl-CoA thioester hydrolase
MPVAPAPCAPAPTRFLLPVRVYYEDTDAGGVVYYANYLRWFERARTEAMRALGHGQEALARELGVLFVVAEARIRYLRPARLDDEVVVESGIDGRGASFLVFAQRVLRAGELLCEGEFKVACVGVGTFRPTRIPAVLESICVPARPPFPPTPPPHAVRARGEPGKVPQ